MPSWSSSCSRSWFSCCRPVGASTRRRVARAIDMVREDIRPSDVLRSEVVRAAGGKTVRPNTAGQKRYVDAISAEHHHVRHRARREPASRIWPWPRPSMRCSPAR